MQVCYAVDTMNPSNKIYQTHSPFFFQSFPSFLYPIITGVNGMQNKTFIWWNMLFIAVNIQKPD